MRGPSLSLSMGEPPSTQVADNHTMNVCSGLLGPVAYNTPEKWRASAAWPRKPTSVNGRRLESFPEASNTPMMSKSHYISQKARRHREMKLNNAKRREVGVWISLEKGKCLGEPPNQPVGTVRFEIIHIKKQKGMCKALGKWSISELQIQQPQWEAFIFGNPPPVNGGNCSSWIGVWSCATASFKG